MKHLFKYSRFARLFCWFWRGHEEVAARSVKTCGHCGKKIYGDE